MNSITNWQCIATIFSLNFMNAKKRNRMTKLQKKQKQTDFLTPAAAQVEVEV